MVQEISELPLWNDIGSISLEEMDSIKLMNRLDTKYVTNLTTLVSILERAAENGYRVCTISAQKIMGYNSLYYDTGDLEMYLAHHNGRKTRQKVRTRTYLVSGVTFLEIKKKSNKGRTKKKRIRIDSYSFENFLSEPSAVEYLDGLSKFKSRTLTPACTTEFERITLVNSAKTERITIDMNLHFRNYRTGIEATIPEGVIIELKQDGRASSEMKDILLSLRVLPYRVSKYCIGTALTNPDVKSNNFKEKVRYINKITAKA